MDVGGKNLYLEPDVGVNVTLHTQQLAFSPKVRVLDIAVH